MITAATRGSEWGMETTTYQIVAVTYKADAPFTFILLQDTDATSLDFPQQIRVSCPASDELVTVFCQVPTDKQTAFHYDTYI